MTSGLSFLEHLRSLTFYLNKKIEEMGQQIEARPISFLYSFAFDVSWTNLSNFA